MTPSAKTARAPAHEAHRAGTLSPSEREVLWDIEEHFWTSDADNARAAVELVAKLRPCLETGWEFVHLFRAQQDRPMRFPCAEVEAGLWLDPEEVESWILRRPQDFATGFLESWKALKSVP